MRLVPKRLVPLAAALVALAVGLPASPLEGHPFCPTTSVETRALSRAVEWLLARQAADGGWHSETYGLLRSGKALTPFVLNALLQIPPEVARVPDDAIARAFDFIRARIDDDGALGRGEALHEEYPNYATALAVTCFARAKPPGWRETIAPMVACLRRQQFEESRGWRPEHPAYGGWGMGGPLRSPPEPGHVDLSMTRFVLEALAAAGVPADDPAIRRAHRFLSRCQCLGVADAPGGFAFSPVVDAANKAGRDGEGFRAYGTPTADGVLALLAAGARPDDARVRAASRWLAANHRTDRVPGFPPNPDDPWDEAMRFYYLAGSAETFAALGDAAPAGWRAGMISALVAAQRADGSFANLCVLGKEDDPLIATGLSVGALLSARQIRHSTTVSPVASTRNGNSRS